MEISKEKLTKKHSFSDLTRVLLSNYISKATAVANNKVFRPKHFFSFLWEDDHYAKFLRKNLKKNENLCCTNFPGFF